MKLIINFTCWLLYCEYIAQIALDYKLCIDFHRDDLQKKSERLRLVGMRRDEVQKSCLLARCIYISYLYESRQKWHVNHMYDYEEEITAHANYNYQQSVLMV